MYQWRFPSQKWNPATQYTNITLVSKFQVTVCSSCKKNEESGQETCMSKIVYSLPLE